MGGTPNDERTSIEESFQRGELLGIAATIQAGGVAITLTRSHHALFTDLEWTPALNAQAEDRICRIGQTNGCIITRLQANHVLDERINELLSQKQTLITSSVDAARVVESATPDISDCDFGLMIKAAEEETRLASLPKKPEAIKPSRFRLPRTQHERWAWDGLLTLAGLDPDRAGTRNDAGFNGTDTGFGHALAECIKDRAGLTDAQFKSARSMCVKYHRQIGKCPEDDPRCVLHEDCAASPQLGLACLLEWSVGT